MVIAIEGLDGVGKTIVAKELAQRLNFKYVEKPLMNSFEDDSYAKYYEIKKSINNLKDYNLNAWFYGLNYLYCMDKFQNQNIVCDRCLVSNYAWVYTKENEYIFSDIVNYNKLPDITFLLTLDKNIILERIVKRGDFDFESCKFGYIDEASKNIKYLLDKYKIKYFEINRDKKNIQETVDEIIDILSKQSKIKF